MRKEQAGLPILPASLLVAGKPCLVVGGGAIAARKVGHLLDAGAKVTVVSPEVDEDLRALLVAKRITVKERRFAESDVKGKCLAIATTDSKTVNRQVLAACRRHGVLSSSADSSWKKGDFVTPAICRRGDLVVSVSTGGRSCVQAKRVKERITALLNASEEGS